MTDQGDVFNQNSTHDVENPPEKFQETLSAPQPARKQQTKSSRNGDPRASFWLRFANVLIAVALWIFLQYEIEEHDFCIWLALDQVPILLCVAVAVVPEVARNQMIVGLNVCHTALIYFVLVVNFVGILRQMHSRFHVQYSELAPEIWEYREFRRMIECSCVILALKLGRKLGPSDPLLINSIIRLFLPMGVSFTALSLIYVCCRLQ